MAWMTDDCSVLLADCTRFDTERTQDSYRNDCGSTVALVM